MFADSKLQAITGDTKKAFEFVVGALLTFFPPRYRQGRALRFEAMAASVFQGILASSFLTYRLMRFSWERAGIFGAPLDTPSNLCTRPTSLRVRRSLHAQDVTLPDR